VLKTNNKEFSFKGSLLLMVKHSLSKMVRNNYYN
jgi:hypothetical protein